MTSKLVKRVRRIIDLLLLANKMERKEEIYFSNEEIEITRSNLEQAMIFLERVESSIEEARDLVKEVLESSSKKDEKLREVYSILSDVLTLPSEITNEDQ